jgi:preprotein translocase subunit SecD
MRSSQKIWLASVLVLAIAAFLAVFQPVTFSPRKDPSDSSKYLRHIGAAKFDPDIPPTDGSLNLADKLDVYAYVPQHDLKLGLDLRGGMRVVLEIPDRAEFKYELAEPGLSGATEASMKQATLIAALTTAFGEDPTAMKKIQVNVNEHQVRVVTQPDSAEQAKYQFDRITTAMTTVFGADKFTAPKAKAAYNPEKLNEQRRQMQDSVLNIMEKRLNGTGLSEVTAYAKGTNQVVLEIPGVKDPERVREVLKTTAQMEFRLLPQDITVSSPDDDTGDVTISRGGNDITHAEAVAASYLVVPGSDLDPTSDVTVDQQNRPAVSFSIKGKAARDHFATQTAAYAKTGRQLAIVLDGKIITAPTIESRIDGDGIISGGFEDMREAKNLAVLLNAGALPVPVDIVENRLVSATLGADSVALSLKAGLIGLLAVLVFMFAYYRLPGMMANFALAIYIVLSLAVLWLFNATLTLPGIAGLIISIGMAVDANVIIFERLKEELRLQKPLDSAIDVAFARAWTAILDSNVASLITGTVLYWLGTGAVRGFAVTLIIGVAVSMFTAITVTRLFMKLMIRSKAGHNLAWYGV